MFHILQIPFYAMTEMKATSGFSMIGQLLSLIIMFLLIVAAAYLTSKYIAKKGVVMAGNRNLKIVEKMNMGIDKAMYIMNVGDCYYLIAVGKNTFQLIDKLGKEQIQIFQNETTTGIANKVFDTYLEKFMKKSKTNEVDSVNQFETIDQFDFVNSKDHLLSKLYQVKSRSVGLNKHIDKDENDEI
jgi:flagellar protein FliO/FliZ